MENTEMKISNTLVNDTESGKVAYAEQLFDLSINWANYSDLSSKSDADKYQSKLNELFLLLYEDFKEYQDKVDNLEVCKFEVYSSIDDPTINPSSSVIYLIGPIGSGADKYEEYIYDDDELNPHFVKIGETSIDLSGKQDKLTAGSNISIANNNTISVTGIVYPTDITVNELIGSSITSATRDKLIALRESYASRNNFIILLSYTNGGVTFTNVPAICTSNGNTFEFYFYHERKHVTVTGDPSNNYTVTVKDLASIVKLTQNEYDALQSKDPNTFYIITS